MVKKYAKFVAKSPYKNKLIKLLDDLECGNVDVYDIVPLQGYPGYFRVRIGKARVIYTYKDQELYVVKIDNRGDVY